MRHLLIGITASMLMATTACAKETTVNPVYRVAVVTDAQGKELPYVPYEGLNSQSFSIDLIILKVNNSNNETILFSLSDLERIYLHTDTEMQEQIVNQILSTIDEGSFKTETFQIQTDIGKINLTVKVGENSQFIPEIPNTPFDPENINMQITIGHEDLRNKAVLRMRLAHEVAHLNQIIGILRMILNNKIAFYDVYTVFFQLYSYQTPNIPEQYRREVMPNWYEFREANILRTENPEAFEKFYIAGTYLRYAADKWNELFSIDQTEPDIRSDQWHDWEKEINWIYENQNKTSGQRHLHSVIDLQQKQRQNRSNPQRLRTGKGNLRKY